MKNIFSAISTLFIIAKAGATCPSGYVEYTASDSDYQIAIDDNCPSGFIPSTDSEPVISSGATTGSDSLGNYSIVCSGTP